MTPRDQITSPLLYDNLYYLKNVNSQEIQLTISHTMVIWGQLFLDRLKISQVMSSNLIETHIQLLGPE
jgi:hypothetical protein